MFPFSYFKNVFSYKKKFHRQQQYQNLTVDVSSGVGAPWRCGVLAALGGMAGFGLGHLLGKKHDSTPRSGVGALVVSDDG